MINCLKRSRTNCGVWIRARSAHCGFRSRWIKQFYKLHAHEWPGTNGCES